MPYDPPRDRHGDPRLRARRAHPYIAMQLCPNGSLYEHVRYVGPLTADELKRVGVPLSDALATAHAAGIVHRDVKPGNMLVNGYGVMVLSIVAAAADEERHWRRAVLPVQIRGSNPWVFHCVAGRVAGGEVVGSSFGPA